MILWKKPVHQVRRTRTTYIFHFLFPSLQVANGEPSAVWKVWHHFSDYHCSTTAAVSLSDCYNETMLHVHGDQHWEMLSCGLLSPMLPSDLLHPVPARPACRWGHVRSTHRSSCPSAPEICWVSHMTDKNTCLADAVIAVDFDIINPKVFWWFFSMRTNKFPCAFVLSYRAFSEDTGWDGLILPVPECSFEGLFRTVSCHLQTQCLCSGDVPEKLRNRDV